MIELLTLGLSILLGVLTYLLGYKRATKYREYPLYQYAMMIAKTAPEEWINDGKGFLHPELGRLA